jgi:hypothetical protein
MFCEVKQEILPTSKYMKAPLQLLIAGVVHDTAAAVVAAVVAAVAAAAVVAGNRYFPWPEINRIVNMSKLSDHQTSFILTLMSCNVLPSSEFIITVAASGKLC